MPNVGAHCIPASSRSCVRPDMCAHCHACKESAKHVGWLVQACCNSETCRSSPRRVSPLRATRSSQQSNSTRSSQQSNSTHSSQQSNLTRSSQQSNSKRSSQQSNSTRSSQQQEARMQLCSSDIQVKLPVRQKCATT